MSGKKIAIIKLIALCFIVLVIPITLYFIYQDTLFNINWLQNNLINALSTHKAYAVIALIIIQAIQVIICFLPGQPIQFVSSYLYGVLGGYTISIVGAILGAYIAFNLAKWLGRDAIDILFGENKVENYKNKINSGKGLLIVFILYLVPGLPKDIISYVAGISRMRILPFLVISTIGRTPGMLGSLFFGYFFQSRNYIAMLIIGIICLIILAICWFNRSRIINYMDKIEAKDIEREERHHGKTAK